MFAEYQFTYAPEDSAIRCALCAVVHACMLRVGKAPSGVEIDTCRFGLKRARGRAFAHYCIIVRTRCYFVWRVHIYTQTYRINTHLHPPIIYPLIFPGKATAAAAFNTHIYTVTDTHTQAQRLCGTIGAVGCFWLVSAPPPLDTRITRHHALRAHERRPHDGTLPVVIEKVFCMHASRCKEEKEHPHTASTERRLRGETRGHHADTSDRSKRCS